MKKPIVILRLLLTAASTLRGAIDTAPLEHKIEQAFYWHDPALLDEAQTSLTTALAAEPKDPALLYYCGFADYVRATFSYAKNDKKMLQTGLEKADETLKNVKGAPWDAEATGLRGLITGQLIGARGSASGMTLGPKMARLTGEAYEKAPRSGRVLTFQAVTLLNTPEQFGGDREEALRLFQRAAASFSNEKKPAAGPTWGRAYALNWLAQALLKTGDLSGAKTAAEQALAVEPDYKFVRLQLLPAIERKAAPKS